MCDLHTVDQNNFNFGIKTSPSRNVIRNCCRRNDGIEKTKSDKEVQIEG